MKHLKFGSKKEAKAWLKNITDHDVLGYKKVSNMNRTIRYKVARWIYIEQLLAPTLVVWLSESGKLEASAGFDKGAELCYDIPEIKPTP